jgi:hypothetical protein
MEQVPYKHLMPPVVGETDAPLMSERTRKIVIWISAGLAAAAAAYLIYRWFTSREKTKLQTHSADDLDVTNYMIASEQWDNENRALGESLGYPQCCIDQFCSEPPRYYKNKIAADVIMQMRYQASHVDGKYTGFIPCTKHAHLILAGDIRIEDLITNRDSELPAFPLVGATDFTEPLVKSDPVIEQSKPAMSVKEFLKSQPDFLEKNEQVKNVHTDGDAPE